MAEDESLDIPADITEASEQSPPNPSWERVQLARHPKRPHSRDYIERLPTEEELSRWWRQWPHANVGIVLGKLSRMGAWDVDGKEAGGLLRELLGNELPDTDCADYAD